MEKERRFVSLIFEFFSKCYYIYREIYKLMV